MNHFDDDKYFEKLNLWINFATNLFGIEAAHFPNVLNWSTDWSYAQKSTVTRESNLLSAEYTESDSL